MEITFLGHAGFFVETKNIILVMDPWLSSSGAFDGGWFQFPRNHHLADFVRERLATNVNKRALIYISHEHKDHYDEEFLKTLEDCDFEYILPKFRRTVLIDKIKSFSNKNVILCEDESTIILNTDEFLKIYTEDSELNRDSAILISSETEKFLNLNDCKIHDRLKHIKDTEIHIDYFAVQFSGATWHPTCYNYSIEEYEKISFKKKMSKFQATKIAIEIVDPKVYIPSAGPACFLDPDIIHLNFERNNIFPRTEEIVDFLRKQLNNKKILVPNIAPGDMLNFQKSQSFIRSNHIRVNEDNFKEYINSYAKEYEHFFLEIKKPLEPLAFNKMLDDLKKELKLKLESFKSKNQLHRPLYIGFLDRQNYYLKVDFIENEVILINEIPEENFYLLKAYSYDVNRVLKGFLTWEDFALTFRVKLNREPDVYQSLMQGFMILEKEDLNFFCDKILEIENRTERIVVEVAGCKYSIDRYCPHQGADLKYAWSEGDRFLICPRHRWSFDLMKEGSCDGNSGTINAIPLETE
jgi:UDP-MurNAc hydroxylase